MRRGFAFVVFAGCASGSSPNAPIDSNNGGIDAPSLIDATPQIDAAPNVDAAPNIDAAPPIDAALTPDACVPMVTELLVNANFDNATITPWTEVRYDSTIPLIGAFSNPPHTGTKYTWLGGYETAGNDASDYVYQQFTVPPMTSQLVVSGYMRMTSEDTYPGADEVYVGLTFPPNFTTAPIVILHKQNLDVGQFGQWTPFAQTIQTPLSGQTVRFQMESVSDFLDLTNFMFDTVSVKATHGCP